MVGFSFLYRSCLLIEQEACKKKKDCPASVVVYHPVVDGRQDGQIATCSETVSFIVQTIFFLILLFWWGIDFCTTCWMSKILTF